MGMLVHTWVLIPGERSSEVRMSSPWRRHGDATISVAAASQLLIGVHRATADHRPPPLDVLLSNDVLFGDAPRPVSTDKGWAKHRAPTNHDQGPRLPQHSVAAEDHGYD
jgi:hypothetical protein